MALDGNRTGPFSRRQLIDRVAPLPKDADLHVWNEKLGSWKPPAEVPALAGELATRRRPPTLAPAPPPPPPFPGTPRRPTAPAVPIAAAAPAPARQTGAHPVVGSAIGPGVGLKLPPPVAPPGGRRPTGPVARPLGLFGAEPAPSAAPGSSGPDLGLDIDPSSMLETPAPQPHMLHGLATNGVAHADQSASNGTSTSADKSDVLNTLNLASASGAGPAPRLLSSEAVVGWQPSAGEAPAARQRTTYIILAFLGVIAAVCVVLFLNVAKKPKPAAVLPAKTVTDPLAGIVDNPPPPSPPTPVAPPAVAPTPEPAPEPASHGHGKGRPLAHGRGAAPISPTAPPPVGATTAPAPVAENTDNNARYRDTGRNMNITGGSGNARPAPSQSDISRVIKTTAAGSRTATSALCCATTASLTARSA